MKFDIRTKIFLVALLIITPMFCLRAALDIALVPRFICLSVVLIAGIFLCIKDFPKEKYLTAFDACFLTYYLVSAASILWAFNAAEAIFEAQKVFAVFLTYLMIRFLLQKSEGRLIPFILLCNVVITLITLGVTCWQINESPTLFRLAYHQFNKLTGLSAQKNLLCSFLYLTLIFNMLALTYFKNKKWRVGLFTLIGIQFFTLLLLQNRATYMAIILSGAFFIIGFQVITRYFNLKRIAILITIVLVLIGSLLARLNLVDDDFWVYVQKADVTKYLTSSSAQERIYMWKRTISMAKEQPLTGVGAGNWAILLPRYGIHSNWSGTNDVFYQRPHNDFLWVFSETGIIGFLVYVGMFLTAFAVGIKALKMTAEAHERLRVWILLSGLVGYIVVANFSFPKERIEHQTWLVLLFSFLLYYSKKHYKNIPRLSLSKINTRLFVLIGLLGLGLNVVIGHYRYQGEKAMREVYIDATPNARKKQLLRDAESYFYKLDHVGFPMSWYAGIIANAESNPKEALEYFTTAYERNPFNFKILSDLAAVHGNLNNQEEAKKYLIKAQNINPENDGVIFNLAVLHYNWKDYTAAFNWAQKLSDKHPRKKELLQRLEGK